MWKRLHVKCRLFLQDFNKTWIFSTDIRKKKHQILIFIKIRPLGAQLLHADGQMDMTKLTVVFRNFANAPDQRLILKWRITIIKCQCPVCSSSQAIVMTDDSNNDKPTLTQNGNPPSAYIAVCFLNTSHSVPFERQKSSYHICLFLNVTFSRFLLPQNACISRRCRKEKPAPEDAEVGPHCNTSHATQKLSPEHEIRESRI